MGDCVTARKTSFCDIRDERAVRIADYIVSSGATVRDAAKVFGVSKSTVHKDVTSRLFACDAALFEKVSRTCAYTIHTILADALEKALSETLGCDARWVTLSIEDYNGKQWQDVFKKEVTENEEHLYKKPQYDPKILL